MSLRPLRRAAPPVAGTALVLGLAMAQAAPARAAAHGHHAPRATAAAGWHVAQVYGADSVLGSITAPSASDAFAAGTSCGSPCTATSLLASHWDGRSWQQLAPPSGFSTKVGGAVTAASSASDAWVFADIGATVDYAVGLHWNGTAWDISRRLPKGTVISAAVAPGPGDAWAFGQLTGPRATPYVVHYDGTGWQRIPFPIVVTAASATSASDIWVIGQTVAPGSTQSKVLTLHWNGTTWRTVTLPPITLPHRDVYQPAAIDAVTPRDVWADAVPVSGRGIVVGAILLHWDGTAWTQASAPTHVYQPGPLAGDGHHGLWLAAFNTKFQPVLYHSVGGAWTHQRVPATSGDTTQLAALATIGGTHSVWGAATMFPYPQNPQGISQGAVLQYGP